VGVGEKVEILWLPQIQKWWVAQNNGADDYFSTRPKLSLSMGNL
jgi:hypothetical protein